MLHDGKPEASAAGLPGMALIDTVEALENPLLVFFGNTDAIVLHAPDDALRRLPKVHMNPSALAGVFHSVIRKIIKNLIEQPVNTPDVPRVLPGKNKIDLLLLRLMLQIFQHFPAHLADIHSLKRQLPAVLIQLGKLDDILHQCFQAGGLVMNPACKFRNILRPHQTVFHDLRIAGNGHEGRLELVGNVGRELSSHLSRFLKFLHLPGNLPVLLVQPQQIGRVRLVDQ